MATRKRMGRGRGDPAAGRAEANARGRSSAAEDGDRAKETRERRETTWVRVCANGGNVENGIKKKRTSKGGAQEVACRIAPNGSWRGEWAIVPKISPISTLRRIASTLDIRAQSAAHSDGLCAFFLRLLVHIAGSGLPKLHFG